MAADFDFHWKFEGGKELAAALESLPESVRRPVLLKALKAAGVPMAEQMGSLAPRDTSGFEGEGHVPLADSMKISVATRVMGEFLDRETVGAVAVGPSKDAFWGLFQEYGTAFHGAQPFARPSFDANYEQALAIFRAQMWAEIRAAAESGAAV